MKGYYYEEIVSIIDDLVDWKKIEVHNNYCSESDNMEDYVYHMSEFDDVMEGMTPWQVARAAFYGHRFCPVDDYFWFNSYGNLESEDFCPSVICVGDIAEYMIQKNDDLGLEEVRVVLDEMIEAKVK